ncbi:FadR/GntR family transcriptional regulator [Marinomonas sp.]|uniref:FadR/GntR family transcriptional regulator n=1 Tax=Marinomonas sp. TaxID=1904862 RepID=UPI003BAB7B67
MAANDQKRPRVRGDIQASIARSIAKGEFAAGENLPPEAELAQKFGVSRTALREAIKGLEAKFMVKSRPRVGTSVLPQEEWAILDQDVLSWIADLLNVNIFIEAVLEARRAIEPAAAVLACRRANLTDLSRIENALNAMSAATGNPDAFTDADLAFHEALLMASHNPVFAQFVHSVRAGLNLMLLASNKSVEDYSRTIASHKILLDALTMRDEKAAQNASLTLLAHANEDLKRKNKT